jgi:hypothetical protein
MWHCPTVIHPFILSLASPASPCTYPASLIFWICDITQKILLENNIFFISWKESVTEL